MQLLNAFRHKDRPNQSVTWHVPCWWAFARDQRYQKNPSQDRRIIRRHPQPLYLLQKEGSIKVAIPIRQGNHSQHQRLQTRVTRNNGITTLTSRGGEAGHTSESTSRCVDHAQGCQHSCSKTKSQLESANEREIYGGIRKTENEQHMPAIPNDGTKSLFKHYAKNTPDQVHSARRPETDPGYIKILVNDHELVLRLPLPKCQPSKNPFSSDHKDAQSCNRVSHHVHRDGSQPGQDVVTLGNQLAEQVPSSACCVQEVWSKFLCPGTLSIGVQQPLKPCLSPVHQVAEPDIVKSEHHQTDSKLRPAAHRTRIQSTHLPTCKLSDHGHRHQDDGTQFHTSVSRRALHPRIPSHQLECPLSHNQAQIPNDYARYLLDCHLDHHSKRGERKSHQHSASCTHLHEPGTAQIQHEARSSHSPHNYFGQHGSTKPHNCQRQHYRPDNEDHHKCDHDHHVISQSLSPHEPQRHHRPLIHPSSPLVNNNGTYNHQICPIAHHGVPCAPASPREWSNNHEKMHTPHSSEQASHVDAHAPTQNRDRRMSYVRTRDTQRGRYSRP